MSMFDPHFHNNIGNIGMVISSVKSGSYFGIFFISMFVSYLIPLPEVVALIIFGFVARMSGLNIAVVFLVSVAGTIMGDNLLYRLSFFGNRYVEHFNRKMRKHKIIKYENLVLDNVGKSIYFLRFITGIRFFGPVICGSLGVRWRKFFVHNTLATLIHGAFFIWLGWRYHGRIVALAVEVEVVKNILLFSSAVIVGILVGVFSKKSLRNDKA